MAKQVVAVTGAASGMGLALCKRYLALHPENVVVALDINIDALKALSAELGERFVPRALNVTDVEAWEALMQFIKVQYGRLDILFNNAGIMASSRFDDISIADWDKTMAINFNGVLYGTRAAYLMMKEQKSGTIVNTSSTAGVTPVLYATSYVASKHAIIGLTKSLREEARRYNIKLVAVLPGMVDTQIFDNAMDRGDKNSRVMADKTPVAKISSERAAQYISDGLDKGKSEIVFPMINKVIITLYRIFPSLMARLIVGNQGG